MADKDITNQQLLQSLTLDFGKRFDTLEGRFDTLEEMVSAINKTLANTIDIMATREDVHELKEYIDRRLDDSVDDVELRLGRRIDNFLKPRTNAN